MPVRRLGRACLLALPLPLCAQTLDYAPPPGDVVLSTDSTLVQPTSGPPILVTGGVFRFRHVFIGPGTRVRGVGSRPMVWLVESMTIAGELSVSGEDGSPVETLQSANVPAPGGLGGAGGGHGGAGSPSAIQRDLLGQPGNGVGNVPDLGGGGGQLAVGIYTYLPDDHGSGGGGGTFATLGDPHYPSPALAGTSFAQRRGQGGFGGRGTSGSPSRNVAGGVAGASPFADATSENDFFGAAFDVARLRVVRGELTQLVGGGGGGGGGDLAPNNNPNDPNFALDGKGGGGGGGGGCLVVAASSGITVFNPGRITADGGFGGGGEQAASCNAGGGGGAGAGGLVVLASLGQIVLQVRGETYANRDYDFVMSADGSVCRTGFFDSPVVRSKYPANGQATIAGAVYDSKPLGGFGGMGIVQILARPGDNSDGTNTHLDDNIVLLRNGGILRGGEKQRFLAWRGFDDANGVRVDDFGNPTNVGSNEGDIRPSPVLMPIF
jgi:hypothetical protein